MTDGPTPAPLAETLDDRGGAGAPRTTDREIGRYLVLSVLGQGGLGQVLLAYDPQLDRRVAIKVLAHGATPAAPSQGRRERVLREARALARVVHPGIVAVYDAGFHRDSLYLVMEYVDGKTLREWLEERPRARSEILDVFRQAGRGLAAAHEKRIIHRDFKPDNVLVGVDGRVRVADFGLARMLDAAAPVDAEPDEDPSGPVPQMVTQAGALVGTPAYMAPEQHAREVAGAEADQFAFCVTLHEALYGERPFGGATYGALAANVEAGRLLPPPAGREVPAWLRAVVLRGLATQPAARWPSMAALLDALAVDPDAARRRRLRAAGLMALIGGATTMALVQRDEVACASGAGELAAVWGPEVKAKLGEVFGRAEARSADRRLEGGRGALFAPRPTEDAGSRPSRAVVSDVVARVTDRLDGYGAGWVAMRNDACAATRVRGTQSDAALDQRMRCLDGRLEDVRALISVLARGGDEPLLAQAQLAVAELEPIAGCADLEVLSARVPPPALRASVDEVEGRLARARAFMRMRDFEGGGPIAAAALADARRLGWKPLLSEAALVHGELDVIAERNKEAEAVFREAVRAAAEGHDDDAVARAAIELVNSVGHLQVRLEEAAHLHVLVETALARAGAGDGLRARWATLRGNIAVLENDLPAARAAYEEAAERAARADGPESLGVSEAVFDLCYVLRQQGAYAEALPLGLRAVAIGEKLLGPRHPEVASASSVVGMVLVDLGRYDEAEQAYRRALEIYGATLPLDHPDTLGPKALLGGLLMKRGKLAEARPILEGVLEIRRRLVGAEHYQTIVAEAQLGRLELAEGRVDAAARRLVDAEAAMTRVFGPEHPKTLAISAHVGQMLLARGRPEEALRRFELTRRVLETKLGSEHRDVGRALGDCGMALAVLGRKAEAWAELERAMAVLERALGPKHPDLLEIHAALEKLK